MQRTDRTDPEGIKHGGMATDGSPGSTAGDGTAGEKTRAVTKITASIDEHRSAIAAIVLPGNTIGGMASACRVSFGFITRKPG